MKIVLKRGRAKYCAASSSAHPRGGQASALRRSSSERTRQHGLVNLVRGREHATRLFVNKSAIFERQLLCGVNIMSAEIKEQSQEYLLVPQQDVEVANQPSSSNRCSADFQNTCSARFDRFSWHEHVYRRLTTKPTPHYIENILGLANVTPPVSPLQNYPPAPPVSGVEMEVNEPLNLSVRTDQKTRTRNTKETVTRKRKKNREPLDLKVSITQNTMSLSQNEAHRQSSQIDTAQPTVVEELADNKKGKKKARTTFTGRQIFELEKQFEQKKYLSSSERSEMAKLLNVTETQEISQVKIEY
ncbi:hypothetical protein GWI33_012935 [Rhynchophorus ferrugineus]|uniref:Homeobox domain-containing protein n=1 Tax=Rhynchophorus ferrugineus TaxID=354439 RepID=A0A834IAQ9_RHYFE|nr:hypothetical protein GWI33_012935 [Rhynchophorus ferrugineus]